MTPACAATPPHTLRPLQVVLASGGGHLVYLELGEGAIREAGHAQLEAEIACLDVTPTGLRGPAPAAPAAAA